MLTELKACYSPQDMIFVISLFIMLLVSVGSFAVLMAYGIRGALQEVRSIKSKQ